MNSSENLRELPVNSIVLDPRSEEIGTILNSLDNSFSCLAYNVFTKGATTCFRGGGGRSPLSPTPMNLLLVQMTSIGWLCSKSQIIELLSKNIHWLPCCIRNHFLVSILSQDQI